MERIALLGAGGKMGVRCPATSRVALQSEERGGLAEGVERLRAAVGVDCVPQARRWPMLRRSSLRFLTG